MSPSRHFEQLPAYIRDADETANRLVGRQLRLQMMLRAASRESERVALSLELAHASHDAQRAVARVQEFLTAYRRSGS